MKGLAPILIVIVLGIMGAVTFTVSITSSSLVRKQVALAGTTNLAFRANETGVDLVQMLLSNYTVYQEPHWDGSVDWLSALTSNNWKNQSGPPVGWDFYPNTNTQPAMLGTVVCNPAFFTPQEWSNVYAQGTPPALASCNTLNRNFDSEVSFVKTHNDFTNNVYWLETAAKVNVPTTAQGATSPSQLQGFLAKAKIRLPPPKPKCELRAAPDAIRSGQSTTLHLTTLASVKGAVWDWDGAPAPKEGGTRTVTPTVATTTYTEITYTVTVQGPPGTPPSACSTKLKVSSPCRFGDPSYWEWVNPFGAIQLGQSRPCTIWNRGFLFDLDSGAYAGCPGGAVCYQFYSCPGYCNPYGRGDCQYLSGYIGNAGSESCYVQFVYVRGWGCFSADTEITLADLTTKKASQIRSGDWLWNPIRRSPARVKKVVAGPEKKPMMEIVGSDFRLKVTETHPFPTENEILQAKDLRPGDSVLGNGGRLLTIERVGRFFLSSDDRVWNFELEESSGSWEDHVVLANGIMTGDLVLQNKLEKRGEEK